MAALRCCGIGGWPYRGSWLWWLETPKNAARPGEQKLLLNIIKGFRLQPVISKDCNPRPGGSIRYFSSVFSVFVITESGWPWRHLKYSVCSVFVSFGNSL